MLFALALLCITIVIEGSVLYVSGYRSGRDVLCVVCINVITHPVLSFILMHHNVLCPVWDYAIVVVVLEVVVVFVEAALWRFVYGWSVARALGMSLCMNVVSYGCGMIFL